MDALIKRFKVQSEKVKAPLKDHHTALAPTYFSLSLLLLFSSIRPADIFGTWLLLPLLTLIIQRVRRGWLA